jgi:hypothetical protein
MLLPAAPHFPLTPGHRPSAAETPQEADLVVFNAKVYTVDPKQMAIVPGFID